MAVTIKIDVDDDEARRELAAFRKELRESEKDAKRLARAAPRRIGARPGARLPGAVPVGGRIAGVLGGAVAIAATLAAVFALAKTIQASVDLIGQRIARIPGFGELGREIQEGTAKAGEDILGKIPALLGAIRGAAEVSIPLARAGIQQTPEQVLGLAKRFGDEAAREFAEAQRRRSRDLGAAFDFGAGILGLGAER